jgi:hypothetical protein
LSKLGTDGNNSESFNLEKTVLVTRDIGADDIEKMFKDGLKIPSLASLKNRPLTLRLRTLQNLGNAPFLREEVSIFWTKKSIDDLFGAEEVIYSVGDRTYMYNLGLPSDISCPFSIVE